MTLDLDATVREATEWQHEQERRRQMAGESVSLYYGRLLLEDDARVEAGLPSTIPAGSRALVEARRLPAERVAHLADPTYTATRWANAQAERVSRSKANQRAMELLSDPDAVDALERLLARERGKKAA